MSVLSHPESPSTAQSRASQHRDTAMKLQVYQAAASKTSKFHEAPPKDIQRIIVATLGLNGEAGEFTESIKHWLGHDHDLDTDNVQEELGDLMWYICELATAFGLDIEDVLSANLHKLAERYPSGFNTPDSIARADKK